MYSRVNPVAVRAAPALGMPDHASGGWPAYVVEYEADADDWQTAGWFRAFAEAMRVASAFERARVRLVVL